MTLSTPFLSPEPAAATARDVLQRTLSEGARKKRKLPPTADDASKKKPLVGKENEVNKVENESATRRLEFAATTPSKPEKKAKKKAEVVPESSVSSSSSEGDDEVSSASSDECEVTFDAMTLGNLRIVREAVPSPQSTTSTASSATAKPIGLEYQFTVSSTVSSIAVAPDGKFLVVGFYNGRIILYPLTQDSMRYRHGVLLAQITPRALITQLMVRVALPDDGKFIFAGVYRGSTEIRAFEVDSIQLPSVERLAQTAISRGTDDDSDPDSDDEDRSGVPTALSVSHTYSDAKLKGFSDVKSVIRKSNNKTEYHLLCGLGIKNIHLWRFYHDDRSNQWAWECIFDKQNNGISIEMMCFHRDVDNQIISKSEHQNIRIWNLEEDEISGELKKKSHIDVKQTVDVTAVYGDHAYGGGESLALIDLRTSSRLELDLPLSAKEQAAKEANTRVNAGTRITASMRGRRSTRGRGLADESTNGQRLMRMVSQVAGRDTAPFVVGMCTDGSVFMHRPQPETTGFATPLEYVEGYEDYFHDPSLGFQAQFSDLTRVNTSGLLAVLPLPETEKEDWMIVAANANQLLVRSMDAFLHRNEQRQEHGRVKRGLRQALKDMGDESSSSDSDSDGNSSSDEEHTQPKTASRIPRAKPVRSERRKDGAREKSKRISRLNIETSEADINVADGVNAEALGTPKTSLLSKRSEEKKPIALLPKTHDRTQEEVESMAPTSLSTPVRKTSPVGLTPRNLAVPSPVVSISSPSASSNPNTPERVKLLSQDERRALVAKELEWTPQASTPAANASLPPGVVGDDVQTEEQRGSFKRGKQAKRKPNKPRSKGVAQALFVNDDPDTVSGGNMMQHVGFKRPAIDPVEVSAVKKLAVSGDLEQLSPSTSVVPEANEEDCTDVEDDLGEPDTEFDFTPLQSEGGSLLSAALYRFVSGVSHESVETTHTYNHEEVELVMRFSNQLERLRKSYTVERERIMSHFMKTECDCSSTKKKTSAGSKLNWRKSLCGEASKKKHIKRRQKKQLAAKLKDIRNSYETKLSDIRLLQRLELQAFNARREFQLLAAQL